MSISAAARSSSRVKGNFNPTKEDPMGKITVAEFVSLDGVMEDPGGAEGYKPAAGPSSTPTTRA